MMASAMATFAQFERRLIGQRTRDALAQKKLEGSCSGALGRWPATPASASSASAKRARLRCDYG
jgi:DNA invertase Pin-like site-specific DNA recombinase